jgi:hypothetical protein
VSPEELYLFEEDKGVYKRTPPQTLTQTSINVHIVRRKENNKVQRGAAVLKVIRGPCKKRHSPRNSVQAMQISSRKNQ